MEKYMPKNLHLTKWWLKKKVANQIKKSIRGSSSKDGDDFCFNLYQSWSKLDKKFVSLFFIKAKI